MSGTLEGGKKAAKTNIKKYGKDYYKNIAKKASHPGTGGFASDKIGKDGLTGAERAKIAGAKGGHISKRKPAITLADLNAASKLAQVLVDYIPTEVK